ncbi:SDR family oxidoreductase [Nitrospinota bacterium]
MGASPPPGIPPRLPTRPRRRAYTPSPGFWPPNLGGDGVAVNALAPSTTVTERTEALRSEEQKARIAASALVGRIAEVEEIVGWVLFIASPEASHLTGQTVSINGGRHAGGVRRDVYAERSLCAPQRRLPWEADQNPAQSVSRD